MDHMMALHAGGFAPPRWVVGFRHRHCFHIMHSDGRKRRIAVRAAEEEEAPPPPPPPPPPLLPSPLTTTVKRTEGGSGGGFGGGSSPLSKTKNSRNKGSGRGKKEREEPVVRRRDPLPSSFSSPLSPEQQLQQPPKMEEAAFLLAWLGLGALIFLEGIGLAASGFLPEELDAFFVKYVYPSFTPTVVVFVGGTVAYGVLKYLGSGPRES